MFVKKNQGKSLETKIKETPKTGIDGTNHTVRTEDDRILYRKLISTLVKIQRSPKKDLLPNKHHLRGPGGNYVSVSGKLEEGITPSRNRWSEK